MLKFVFFRFLWYNNIFKRWGVIDEILSRWSWITFEDKIRNTFTKIWSIWWIFKKVILNVREQIYSFISILNDLLIRKGLCVIGLEDGTFYLLKANLNIKCFVVVAIRNSLVESIHSVDFRKAGLIEHIPGNPMKEVTAEAITYFNKIDFCEMCKK